jgi:hypothetical protein
MGTTVLKAVIDGEAAGVVDLTRRALEAETG